MSAHEPPQVPIAIVGISALLPGSTDVPGFWRNIVEGNDQITDVPPDRWLVEDYYDPDPHAPDKTYCRRGAFLPDSEFDCLAHGVPPAILQTTDTAQLLALIAAEQALMDATGGRLDAVDTERVGVILGAAQLELTGEMSTRLMRPIETKVLREHGLPESEVRRICDAVADYAPPWQESTFPGLLGNVIAGRIANRFDLHGPNCTTDAACASSFAALSMAVDELVLRRADMMLTGGVDTFNSAFAYLCFSKTPALSPTGDCRPFAEGADGTVLGEGVVMFALKRLADAEAAGDRIYAVIRGVGSSSDGRGASIYAPVPAGQVRAVRRAYAEAGYGPDAVELVEAHGTGTVAGDMAEFEALCEVFDAAGRSDRQWCALGSAKSQYGHTKCAAGAVGLLKAVLALHHRILPPTIKVDQPDCRLDFACSPLYLNTRSRPWVSVRPRRAGVSSFGFGGTNFHVTVEEYRPSATGGAPVRCRVVPDELVLLSADSPEELRARCAMGADVDLTVLAYESQRDFRSEQSARLAVVAGDIAGLREKLSQAAERIGQDPHAAFATPAGIAYAAGDYEPGKVAFLFPGQGSQYVGMGADLAIHSAQASAVWDRAAEILPELNSVVHPIPAFTDDERSAQTERLTATEWAQPALAATSSALLHALGVRPDCVAGHSFGELVALHAAGAFDEDTLMWLARRRGEVMRDAAATAGAMSAALAGAEEVTAALDQGEVSEVWVANHNGPDEVVLSGTCEGIAAAEQVLARIGIRTRRLDTATAFHSPLVAQAVEPLTEYLAGVEVSAPAILVYGNSDATPYPSDPIEIRGRLAEQITAPVRFADVIERMYGDGVRTFVEVGPGATLTGLVGRILGDREHLAVAIDRAGMHGITSLHRALAQLAVRGVRLDCAHLWDGAPPPVIRPSEHEPDRPRMVTALNGGNAGTKYPPPGGAAALPPPNPEPVTAHTVTARTEADRIAVVMDGSVAQAIQEAQRQTAEAHAAYQRAMAETHTAYLRMAEQSLTTLVALLGTDQPHPTRTPVVPIPDEPARSEPVNELSLQAATPLGEPVDIASTVLAIVADKTGYPVELIGLDMQIDTDLGIDSIKRVDILSSLRKEMPWLPDIGASTTDQLAELMTIRTVGEIVEHLENALPASVPDTSPPVGGKSVARLTVHAVAVSSCGQAMVGLDRIPLLVTDDGGGVAEDVVKNLAGRGLSAQVVHQVPQDARGVVYLGGLREVHSVEDGVAIVGEAFDVACTVAPGMERDGGIFVTVQDTGGDFGLRGAHGQRCWLGGLAALARTAAAEWPRVAVKAIDCERAGLDAHRIATAIVDELCAGGPELDVGLRADGGRITLDEVPTAAEPGPDIPLDPDSVVVVTGGARGITAAAVRALVARRRLRLVLIGRTPLENEPDGLSSATDEVTLTRLLAGQNGSSPPARLQAQAHRILAIREVRRTVADLTEAGAEVRYLALDVSDRVALRRALAEIRRDWGPVNGIIHGAGVLADMRISEKSDAGFDSVFDTKVVGLQALLEATEGDPLRLLVAFSSVVARFGNVGQCDYAMANETLNHVLAVERIRRPDCLVRSLAWGPWDGGMVSRSLATIFDQAGITVISTSDGADAFATELATHCGEAQILLTTMTALRPLGSHAMPTWQSVAG
ncbi:type I polyketide synthase [Nocardia terpenica]|uniref:Uncharacterized protein n=1 Tax=Nocardia terpenica TaxID=455432 RepID=A0A161WDA7_9NOCA|nr:type I polyketide synthase [Nocardia terpenica]KZM74939.1 hypothetical protein AWN90_23285 [Nocardia terpenica]NQE93398.1 SDR family NAD(P)-dependent oxidoreductase [Nocardia terpenica]